MEHLWWKYIFDCVRLANGTILGTTTSSRINGHWGKLRCAAMFPLDAPSDLDFPNVRAIVLCFRKLQGNWTTTGEWDDQASTEEFRKFVGEVKDAWEGVRDSILPPETRPKWERRELTFESQLERLVVWDPLTESITARFPGLFAENPFSFTLPLWLDTYQDLYGKEDEAATPAPRTRLRLAESVIDKLMPHPGSNVAIVGAHRAGKTTVLNLVHGLLTERVKADHASGASASTLIPIRVNASATPPHMIFVSILEELTEISGLVPKLEASIRRSFAIIVDLAKSLTSNVKFSFAGAMVDFGTSKVDTPRRTTSVAGKLRKLLMSVEEQQRDDLLPEFLRVSLYALRDALAGVDIDSRIVVIMDEFSESTTWGDERTLAVWRHAVESKDLSNIKWLFSTTRPVRESAKYSPLTNIFFEANVGSLRPDESERMIDAFSRPDPKEPGKLRPVVTQQARRFLITVTSSLPYLLQVSCYHIYDRATRIDFPLINKKLCRKVLLSKVLPEIADYLEHQWQDVPQEAKHAIVESLPKISPLEFLETFNRWNLDRESLPPGSLKALDRSGLRGEDERSVAPLVAAWLLSREHFTYT